jgi:MFS superfamily sulfate permease-like transporter
VAVEIQADIGKNRVFIRIQGQLDDADAPGVGDAIIRAMDRMRPGFALISDLTEAEPMGPQGVEQLKRVITASRERKVGQTVRIVGRAAQAALQFARTSKEYQHEPYLAFSREEAERMLDGLPP